MRQPIHNNFRKRRARVVATAAYLRRGEVLKPATSVRKESEIREVTFLMVR